MILLFSGCAADRKVVNNTFYSDFPKMIVKVAPEFSYFRNLKFDEYGKSIDGTRELKYEFDDFSFICCQKGILTKGVSAGIEKIETHYISNLYGNKRNLEYGMIEIAGEQYEFAIKLIYPSMKGARTVALKNAGYMMPRCVINKWHSRIEYGNLIKYVHYWEQPPGQCEKWKEGALLDDQQRQFLIEFNKRAAAAFEVISEEKSDNDTMKIFKQKTGDVASGMLNPVIIILSILPEFIRF